MGLGIIDVPEKKTETRTAPSTQELAWYQYRQLHKELRSRPRYERVGEKVEIRPADGRG